MRTRIPAFTAALVLAALGAAVPVAQAAVPAIPGPTCTAAEGTVEYDSSTGQWTCKGGEHDGELITES
ncbi:hypothetical protein [Streptomyces subrutilus]|uniref:Uncharacterized protein n=1 Tax=Streptomyces subrutilus TaxID=36818 RepID=A0A1E5PU73_9ACTN|nr:hypothetical protein [Streptomyces subrutilus]OEJ33087.1 hypothetical protein BGK67_18750 [Streptomyces subrutilus]